MAIASDKPTRVYDAATGQEAYTLNGTVGYGQPAFSPDGQYIAARANGGVIRVYDAGQVGSRFRPQWLMACGCLLIQSGQPQAFAVNATNAGGDAIVRVYDARMGPEALTLQTPTFVNGTPVFRPDGVQVAVASRDALLVYDVVAGRDLFALKAAGSARPVFSQDGTRIAVGPQLGNSGIVRVCDAHTGAHALAINARVRSVSWPSAPRGADYGPALFPRAQAHPV